VIYPLWFLSKRKRYYSGDMDDPDVPEGYALDTRMEVESDTEANLISSEIKDGNGWHMPVIDIDYEAHLQPSSTSGHYHLYLQIPIDKEKYLRALEAMAEAGMIEPGFAKLARERGASFVRKPGHKKVKKPR
jgi:hypothetical protein